MTPSAAILHHHFPALVLAIVIGVLCAAPQFYFAHTPRYAGIQMIGADAEVHYAARVQEVYDGYPNAGNTFLPQKTQPYLMPNLGENIEARLGELFGLSASQMNTVAKFLFPVLVALLAYAFSYLLFRSRAAGLIGTTIALLGDQLMSNKAVWFDLLHWASPLTSFVTYARPINPEISGLFLFGALILIYRNLYQRDVLPSVIETIGAGFLAGASFYISPFVSTFLLGLIGIGTLWNLYRRQYRGACAACGAFLTALLVLIPYGLNYLAAHTSAAYAIAAGRQGLIVSHTPILGIWIGLFLIAVLFAWPRRHKESKSFFIACALSLIILLNQQLLTGHAIEPGHYHWYITKPLVGIILGMYAVYAAEKMFHRPFLHRICYVIPVLVIFYAGALTQLSSYTAHYGEALAAQAYAPLFTFLKGAHAAEAIWADRTASMYIPLYTNANAINNQYVAYYLVPEFYLEERLLLEYKLRNVTPQSALSLMQQERGDISNTLFGVYWRDQYGDYAAIPDSYLARYAKDYQKIYAEPYASIFNDLGVTAILWDRNAEPQWKIDALPFVHEVYTSGALSLYVLSSPRQ